VSKAKKSITAKSATAKIEGNVKKVRESIIAKYNLGINLTKGFYIDGFVFCLFQGLFFLGYFSANSPFAGYANSYTFLSFTH